MLHTGDTKRGGVRQGTFYCLQPLLVREGRRDPVHVIHGRVFERSGGIPLRIANDDPARRIWSIGCNARQPQRDRVGQGHMAVVAAHEHRRVGSRRVD